MILVVPIRVAATAGLGRALRGLLRSGGLGGRAWWVAGDGFSSLVCWLVWNDVKKKKKTLLYTFRVQNIVNKFNGFCKDSWAEIPLKILFPTNSVGKNLGCTLHWHFWLAKIREHRVFVYRADGGVVDLPSAHLFGVCQKVISILHGKGLLRGCTYLKQTWEVIAKKGHTNYQTFLHSSKLILIQPHRCQSLIRHNDREYAKWEALSYLPLSLYHWWSSSIPCTAFRSRCST